MASTANPPLESLLVADLGRGSSRAYLLEEISGAFRFVAKAESPTTSELPFEDLTIGWSQLLRQLEWETGRKLTDHDNLLIPQLERGDGVDGLLVCSGHGEPLRAVMIEAGANPLGPAILESLRKHHSRVLHLVAPTGRKDTGWATSQSEAIESFAPDLVIVSVGQNHGDSLTRVQQLAKQVGGAIVPDRAFIIAETEQLEELSNSFTKRTRLKTASLSSGQSAGIIRDLERELAELFLARISTTDFKSLTLDAVQPTIPRALSVDLVNRFIARAFERRVLTIAIDDGVHVHAAGPDNGGIVAYPQIDLSASISGLSSKEVVEAAAWLPFEATEDELVTWVLNRSIRPWTVAEQPRDLAIEQALARQVARRAMAELSRSHPLAITGADLVIGGPAFARWNQPGAAALALLDIVDAVPDQGVLDLGLDQDGLMAVAGTIGAIDPVLASNVFEYDALTHLGSAVVIGGAVHEGDVACRGEIHYEHGGSSNFTVASGSVEVLPLRTGETATLSLRPERKFSIGGHPSGKAVALSEDHRIIGGAVGVIVDARGRSVFGTGPNRHVKVKQWLDRVSAGRGSAV
ncbi:MAG: hypothetical protein ACJ789_01705 [Thermomicrobiales bacterium]